MTEATWRWVFFVNVPIGLAAFVFGVVFLTDQPQDDPGGFDLPGFLLSGLGLGAVMYGVSEGPLKGWGTVDVLISITIGVVLLVAMVVVELRTSRPIVALRLFGNRLFRSATIATVLVSIAFFGTLFLVSLYYQDARGLSALNSGLSTFPEALGVILGAQLASRVLYRRLGPRRHVMLGLTGTTTAIALMALASGQQTSLWWMRVLMFALGLAMGQVFVPLNTAAFATISSHDTGGASTMFNTSRQLGGAIGVAVLTTAVVTVGATNTVAGHVVPNVTAYRIAFLVAAAFCAAALPAAASIVDSDAARTIPGRTRRMPDRQRVAPAEEPAGV